MFGLIGAAIPRLNNQLHNHIHSISCYHSKVSQRRIPQMVTRRYNGTRDSIIYRNFSIISSVPLFPQGYLTIVYGTVIGGVIIFFHGIIFIRRYPDFKTRLMSFRKVVHTISELIQNKVHTQTKIHATVIYCHTD